jgi:hypothetical protein
MLVCVNELDYLYSAFLSLTELYNLGAFFIDSLGKKEIDVLLDVSERWCGIAEDFYGFSL